VSAADIGMLRQAVKPGTLGWDALTRVAAVFDAAEAISKWEACAISEVIPYPLIGALDKALAACGVPGDPKAEA